MAKTKAKPQPKPEAAPAGVQAPALPELPPTGPPATSGPETWPELRLNQIRPCAFNVRRHFDPADIADLAASIRANKLKEPLLVRPVGVHGGPAPEWTGMNWVELGGYELADGERRFRALTLLDAEDHGGRGELEVRVIVRPMTDEQVRAIMLVSREQSRDLLTSELVAGYVALAEGRTVEQVAELVGATPGHVRGIMLLAKLPRWGLAAIDAGGLARASAELVARVHGEQSRKRAVAAVMLGYRYGESDVLDKGVKALEAGKALDGGREDPLTYREVKTLIASRFQKELKSAPFSRKALDLVEGVGSCDACPQRAGNDPEATADGVRGDMCLNPDCYRAKEEAWNARVIEKAKDSGNTILANKDAEKLFNKYGSDTLAYNSGYVNLDEKCYDDTGRNRTYRTLLKDHVAADKVVIAVGPKTGAPFELVKADLAKKVLKEQHNLSGNSSSAGSNDNWLKEQRERRKKAEIGRAAGIVANGMVAEVMRDKLPPGFTVFQGGIPLLQQIVATIADFAGADSCRVVAKRRELEKEKYGDRDAVEALAFKLTDPRDLIALLAELAATRRTWNWGSPYTRDNVSDEERAFFKAFGVDRKKLVEEAAAAKKAGKAGGKKDGKAKKGPAGKKDVASLTAAIESSIEQSGADPSSEPTGEDEVRAPAPGAAAPITRLIDIDDFPAAIADALLPLGISTLETLLETLDEEEDADIRALPLRLRLQQFLVDATNKVRPSEHAAEAVAKLVAAREQGAAPKEPAAAVEALAAELTAAVAKGEPIADLGLKPSDFQNQWAALNGFDAMKQYDASAKKPPRVGHVMVNGRPHIVLGVGEHFPGPGTTWEIRPLWPDTHTHQRGIAATPADPLEALFVEIKMGVPAGWLRYQIGAKRETRRLIHVPEKKPKGKKK